MAGNRKVASGRGELARDDAGGGLAALAAWGAKTIKCTTNIDCMTTCTVCVQVVADRMVVGEYRGAAGALCAPASVLRL